MVSVSTNYAESSLFHPGFLPLFSSWRDKVQLHLELTKALRIVHLTKECLGDVANYNFHQDISNFTLSNIKMLIKKFQRISLQCAKKVTSDFPGVADFAVRLEDTHFELYLNVETVICALISGSSGPCSSNPISSPSWGHFVVFLGKTLYFHSASLHPGV